MSPTDHSSNDWPLELYQNTPGCPPAGTDVSVVDADWIPFDSKRMVEPSASIRNGTTLGRDADPVSAVKPLLTNLIISPFVWSLKLSNI